MSAPRFVVAETDDGYVVRVRGGNGKIILSSSTQFYADERDAQRAVEIAREAAAQPVKRVDERTTP